LKWNESSKTSEISNFVEISFVVAEMAVNKSREKFQIKNAIQILNRILSNKQQNPL